MLFFFDIVYVVLLKELHAKYKACVDILLGACFAALAKPMDKQDGDKLTQTHGIKRPWQAL